MLNISRQRAPRSAKSARSEKGVSPRPQLEKDEHVPHKVITFVRTLSQTLEDEKKAKWKAYEIEVEEKAERVISEHEISYLSARTASTSAKRERNNSARCIRETKEFIEIFPKAVKEFDEHMEEVIQKEEKRIEKEEEINKRRLGFQISAVSSKINVKAMMRSCSNCSESTDAATQRSSRPAKKTTNPRMSFRIDARASDIGISQL